MFRDIGDVGSREQISGDTENHIKKFVPHSKANGNTLKDFK